jgi:hypothetical protein
VAALSIVLVGIIAVAFRGSWTAHRDAALAAHFDSTGADLYPFAPDGLILIALIAALVLRHDRKARFYALSVVAVFTLTSFVVNHLHGLGTFAPEEASGLRPELDWAVVALIAGQLIGAIFFGSHLIVSSLRYLFPSTQPEQAERPIGSAVAPVAAADGGTPGAAPERVVETVLVHAAPDPQEVAKLVYGIALDLGTTVGRDRLAKVCGISARAANRIRADVETDRDEKAAQEKEAAEREAAQKAAEKEAARRAAEASGPRQSATKQPNEKAAEAGQDRRTKDEEQADHAFKSAILSAALNGQHAISAPEVEEEDDGFPGVLGGRLIDRGEFLRTGRQANGHGPAGGES